jgi:hypothetical protein
MTDKRDIVIVLGSGYVARFMLSLKNFYVNVLYTSREPHRNLSWAPQNQRLHFDLAIPDTWPNIPPGADLLWCFPAAPVQTVRSFAKGHRVIRKAGGDRQHVGLRCRPLS